MDKKDTTIWYIDKYKPDVLLETTLGDFLGMINKGLTSIHGDDSYKVTRMDFTASYRFFVTAKEYVTWYKKKYKDKRYYHMSKRAWLSNTISK